MDNVKDELPNYIETSQIQMGTIGVGQIEIDSCIVCNSVCKLCEQNIGDLRSQHSEARMCDLIQRSLGTAKLHRNIEGELSRLCVCYDCITKINEYDLACVTAERAGLELQQMLLATDQLYKTNDLLKNHKVQTTRATMSADSNYDGCDNNDADETNDFCVSLNKIEVFETPTLQTHDNDDVDEEDDENDNALSEAENDSEESIRNEIQHVVDNPKAKRIYECDTCPEKFNLWKELRVRKKNLEPTKLSIETKLKVFFLVIAETSC